MIQAVDEKRIRQLNDYRFSKGIIAYWMSRDQRVEDNWALLFARELSLKNQQPLVVVFTLDPNFPNANIRHFHFMLKGLRLIEQQLITRGIALFIRKGEPGTQILKFISELKIGCLVTDFDPLREKRKWKEYVAQEIKIPFWEVDAHNIVPCWTVSEKEEYGAYTIRPKIKKQVPRFLTGFSELIEQEHNPFSGFINDWSTFFEMTSSYSSVPEVKDILPGSIAAKEVLQEFIHKKLPGYNKHKNDPNQDVLSGLSPYLHFGHISSQRIATEIIKEYDDNENAVAFLEELIVRKELSDNFCFYNPFYDSIQGAKNWALVTLAQHSGDEREPVYDHDALEQAKTHDTLWNAAQNEIKKKGKMHGYMRMYWAKKILEWSANPSEALNTAIDLNDKYSLDGRDPNGYTGCMWSIAGIHDRPWTERNIFGKIRYMNYNGCKRKFDVDGYEKYVNQIPP